MSSAEDPPGGVPPSGSVAEIETEARKLVTEGVKHVCLLDEGRSQFFIVIRANE